MLENKKIMMITTTDNMIWQFALPHIRHLQELGNEVHCVCSRTGFWFDELQNKFGLICHEIPFERSPLKFKNLKGYKLLKKLQKQENFDFIYCQQPVGGLMGRLIAKKYKLPCIYITHGNFFFKGNNPLKNFVFKSVEKYLAKYTTVLVTINDEDYNACKDWKAKHIIKIPGIGYDPDKYASPKSREKVRKELGLENQFTILTVAEYTKNKNYDTMLQTIKELENENIIFLSCGTGSEKENIERKIQELDIKDKVKLLGYRKDVNDIMNASDVFLLASHREGLNLSIIEAMNRGLPVVTVNIRGQKDLIDDGKGGFVVDNENDYKALADSIVKIMKNEKLREKMKNVNLKNAQMYTIDNVKKELLKVYKLF